MARLQLEALGGGCSVLEEAGRCQLVHGALLCFCAGVETKEKRYAGSLPSGMSEHIK